MFYTLPGIAELVSIFCVISRSAPHVEVIIRIHIVLAAQPTGPVPWEIVGQLDVNHLKTVPLD